MGKNFLSTMKKKLKPTFLIKNKGGRVQDVPTATPETEMPATAAEGDQELRETDDAITVEQMKHKRKGPSRRQVILQHIVQFIRAESATEYTWERPYYFFLALTGSVLGISELLQVSDNCYSHGGIVYIIIFILMCLILGYPMLVIEISLGQYTGRRHIHVFRSICPVSGGLGYSLLLTMLMISIHSSITFAYCLNYFFASFSPTLPWHSCGHHWNTFACYTKFQEEECSHTKRLFWNNTCTSPKEVCESFNLNFSNETHCTSGSNATIEYAEVQELIERNRTGPPADYFKYIIERPFDELFTSCITVIMYFTGWSLMLVCIRNGLKSSIKVMHGISATIVASLLLLLVATFLSPGAGNKIAEGLAPDFHKLIEMKPWQDAASGVISALKIGLGANYLVASHNAFEKNFVWHVALVVLVEIIVVILFACIVFGCIGTEHFKHLKDTVSELDVNHAGLGVLLRNVPEAFRHIPASQLWLVLFFIFCMATIQEYGFAMVEALVTSLVDMWPALRMWKLWMRIGVTLVGFLMGITLLAVQSSGLTTVVFMFVEKDMILSRILQTVIITWVYGFASPVRQRHARDLTEMIGWKQYTVPIVLAMYSTVPLLTFFGSFPTITKWNVFSKPVSVVVFVFASLLFFFRTPIIIVSYAIYRIILNRKQGQPWRDLLTPDENFMMFRNKE